VDGGEDAERVGELVGDEGGDLASPAVAEESKAVNLVIALLHSIRIQRKSISRTRRRVFGKEVSQLLLLLIIVGRVPRDIGRSSVEQVRNVHLVLVVAIAVRKDVGALVGIGDIGLTATRDVDALVELKADVMCFQGLTYEIPTITAFLRAGTNVYSNMGGWYLPSEPEFEEVEAAAQEGGATLLAGGNIPGLISEVFPLFASGYASEVTMIRA